MGSTKGIPVYQRVSNEGTSRAGVIRTARVAGIQKQTGVPPRGAARVLRSMWQITRLVVGLVFSRKTFGAWLGGVILGRAPLFGAAAPFGIAYACAGATVDRGAAWLARTLGVMVGIATLQGPMEALFAGVVISLFTVLARILRAGHEDTESAGRGGGDRAYGHVPFLLFGASFIVRIVALAIRGFDPYLAAVALMDSALAGLLALAFACGLAALPRGIKGASLMPEEVASILVIASAFISGLSQISAGRITLGGTGAVLATLIIGYAGGAGVGAAAGAVIGLVMSMAEPSFEVVSISALALDLARPVLRNAMPVAGMLAVTGVLAGTVRGWGRGWSALAGVMGPLLFTFQMADPSSVLMHVIQAVAGAVLFALLPVRVLSRARKLVPDAAPVKAQREMMVNRRIQELVARRLKDISGIFAELSRSFRRNPAFTGDEAGEFDIAQMLAQVSERSCSACPSHSHCWNERFYQTYRDLVDLLALAEVNRGITTKDFPDTLKAKCVQSHKLAEAISYLFEGMAQERKWREKLAESSSVVSEQLQGVSELMDSLASEIRTDVEFEEELEKVIADRLCRLGVDIRDVSVMNAGPGRVEVDIVARACRGDEQCRRAVAPIVSKILGRDVGVWNASCRAVTLRDENGREVQACRFRLLPAQKFDVDCDILRAATDGSSVSGDACSVMELPNGRVAVALSDGMGVGPRAYVESDTAVSMLKRLMEGGFAPEYAVSTVNSVLLLRSADETFATIDLAVMDLHTGQMEFFKVGSCPSFIKRGREVRAVKSASLPAGILTGVEAAKTRLSVREGDMLVMVSDGVLECRKDQEDGEEWITKVLQRISATDPEPVSNAVLEYARHASQGKISDDMTVVVVKIVKRGMGRVKDRRYSSSSAVAQVAAARPETA